MKHMNRRTWALVTCFLVVLIAAITVLRSPPEPIYQSRPLSAWVLDLTPTPPTLDGSDERTRAKAADAVRAIGPEAIPLYLKWIAYEPSALKKRTLAIAQRAVSLFRPNTFLHDSSLPRAEAVVFAFEALGTNGSSSVPELTQLLLHTQSTSIMRRAAYALGDIGPEGAVSLRKAAADPNPRLRLAAVEAMPLEWSDLYLDACFERISDPDRDVRRVARRKIIANSYRTAAHFRSLTNALMNSNPNFRIVAVTALEQYGASYLPLIQPLSTDTNAEVRAAVSSATSKLKYE